MSSWRSDSNTDVRREDGAFIGKSEKYYVRATTNTNGEFEFDLSALGDYAVIGVSSYIVGQTLTAVDDISSKLIPIVFQVQNALIRGAVILGDTQLPVLGTPLSPLKRAGDNIEVQLCIDCLLNGDL